MSSDDEGQAAPSASKGSKLLIVVVLAACLGGGAFYYYSARSAELARSRWMANESAAIAACKTFCEAEDIYRREDWDGDGVQEFATSINGDFSLFEKNAGSGDLTLVDAAFAQAEGEPGTAHPKAGYVFKVLTGQGAAAPGGAKSYVEANGNMTLGYALVACPAFYGKTGTQTFIVNNTGVVLQKDLGPGTHAAVGAMTEYNPDETWTIAE